MEASELGYRDTQKELSEHPLEDGMDWAIRSSIVPDTILPEYCEGVHAALDEAKAELDDIFG